MSERGVKAHWVRSWVRYVALLLSVCPRGFRSHHVTMRRACSCLTGPLVQKHRSAKELSACVCVCVREMMDCVSNDRPRYVPSAQCSIYTSSCCVCVVQVTTKAYFVCVCVCLYTSTPYKAWSSHSCNHKCTFQCSSCRTSWIFTALHTLLLTPAQRPPAWFITTHTGICGASPSIRQPVWAVTPRLQDAEASLSQERRRC